MVQNQHLTIGKDFIFTYGPLGSINTRLFPENFNIYWITFIDFFYLFNIIFLIKFAFKKAGNNWIMVALLSLYIFLPWGIFGDTSFTYLYFSIFWILHAQNTRSVWSLWISIAIGIISFFIKVNVGIVGILIIEFGLITLLCKKLISWKLMATHNFVILISIVLLSKFLHLNLLEYVKNSLYIIDGYQDNMACVILKKNEFNVLLFIEIISAILFIIIFYLSRKAIKKTFLLWIFFASIYFLIFKQSHTAISSLNLYGFFLLIPLLAVLIYLFTPNEFSASISKYIIIIILTQSIAIHFLRLMDAQYNFPNYLNSLKNIKYNPKQYFQKLSEYDYENNFKNTKLSLPNRVKQLIGNETVDILNSRIDYIYFNKLNYNPRPIIQSYSAYTPELIHLNGEKYRSTNAPTYVLYHLDNFREQYPFWSDSEVNVELLKRYNLIDNFTAESDSFLLFKKSNEIKNLNIQTMNFQIQLNRKINIPKGQIIRFYGHIEYSFWGKLARLIFQPPYLFCKIGYEDGTYQSFRVVNQILEAGVLVNKKVTTFNELHQYYSSIGEKNKNVSSLEFYSKLDWGFKK
ncbi:hypothetical protein V7S79_09875 [Aquirufa sp. ROCK-SH2]